jgi:hypothetical protein
METKMNLGETSLRLTVEKWLAPSATTTVRVTRFSRIRTSKSRYVCVESSRQDGAIALFFFRHSDGAWRVFPPEIQRLTICAQAMTAT